MRFSELELFTADDLVKLNDAVFDVLENTGMWIESDRLLNALNQYGANVDKNKQIAKFPPSIIDEIIKERKKRPLEHYGEVRPSHSRFKGGVGSVGPCPFYYDYEKKERIRGNRKDLIDTIRLGDSLDETSSVGRDLIMGEEDPRIEPLEVLMLLIENTNRPSTVDSIYAEQVDYFAEVGNVYAGDKKRFLSMGGLWITNPLRISKRSANLMLKMSEYGISCGIGSEPVAGAGAPITAAGAIVLGTSGILGGLIALKSIMPDADLNAGWCNATMDMKTGKVSCSIPEGILMDIGAAELFRKLYGGHLDVSALGYTDAKIPGFQAISEKIFKTTMIGIFTGTPMGFGSWGALDTGSLYSPVQHLLELDLSEGIWRFYQGLEVNNDTLALETIKKVGVGMEASYLNQQHTLRNARKAFWYPSLYNRKPWEGTEKELCFEKELLDKANEKFKSILHEYTPPEIDMSIIMETRRIIEKAKMSLLKN